MRIGRATRFGWAGLVTDDSRVFLVCGISILEIDWDRERTLSAALTAKARARSAREAAWRAHFEQHGLIGGLRRFREGREFASEYMRHQARVQHRTFTNPGLGRVRRSVPPTGVGIPQPTMRVSWLP